MPSETVTTPVSPCRITPAVIPDSRPPLLLLGALQRRGVREPGRQLHRPAVGLQHRDDRRVVVEHRGDGPGGGQAAQRLALDPAGGAVVTVRALCRGPVGRPWRASHVRVSGRFRSGRPVR